LMCDTKEVFGTHFMPDKYFSDEEVHGYTMTILLFVRCAVYPRYFRNTSRQRSPQNRLI
jgi:hypothetical protein